MIETLATARRNWGRLKMLLLAIFGGLIAGLLNAEQGYSQLLRSLAPPPFLLLNGNSLHHFRSKPRHHQPSMEAIKAPKEIRKAVWSLFHLIWSLKTMIGHQMMVFIFLSVGLDLPIQIPLPQALYPCQSFSSSLAELCPLTWLPRPMKMICVSSWSLHLLPHPGNTARCLVIFITALTLQLKPCVASLILTSLMNEGLGSFSAPVNKLWIRLVVDCI